MTLYNFRSDREQTTLEHLPHTAFARDDQPYLSTERYSVNINYEPRDIADKRSLDMHGTTDNLYWYNKTYEDNLAINLGQR